MFTGAMFRDSPSVVKMVRWRGPSPVDRRRANGAIGPENNAGGRILDVLALSKPNASPGVDELMDLGLLRLCE